MMKTPICDFVRRYAEGGALRLHMPGHKGEGLLGCESLDITEISGADSLFEADGIIRESEVNAGSLFECDTFYSAEGSSLCIRGMLFLAAKFAREKGRRPVIAAGRNAHKAFMSGAALLGIDVEWLYAEGNGSYLSCPVTPDGLDGFLSQREEKPVAVYVTSPDYPGNILDIKGLAEVCRRHGVLLLVDNAHGAYLKFLPESLHPMDLGADMCCDSAHKTLPVLTGGAYLHISKNADPFFSENAKQAMSLFASTSPSYLILQSLDAANRYMADGYRERLAEFALRVMSAKKELAAHGFRLLGNEPLKITVGAKSYGYTGYELSGLLQRENIFCEFCDPDLLVLMLTPETKEEGLDRLVRTLKGVERKEPLLSFPPRPVLAERAMSVREAALSLSETLPSDKSAGRVLAAANVSCPPAVPIVTCGERISEEHIRLFEYYGIKECTVVK